MSKKDQNTLLKNLLEYIPIAVFFVVFILIASCNAGVIQDFPRFINFVLQKFLLPVHEVLL